MKDIITKDIVYTWDSSSSLFFSGLDLLGTDHGDELGPVQLSVSVGVKPGHEGGDVVHGQELARVANVGEERLDLSGFEDVVVVGVEEVDKLVTDKFGKSPVKRICI